jgi:thiamine kinase-like enzyme
MNPDDVLALCSELPQWVGRQITIRVLDGGITNRNFIANVDGRDYVVRIPGERTELLGIDRANEAEAAQRAATLGLSPPVVGRLPSVGTLVTELVAGVHLAGVAFTERLDDVVAMLRTFHNSGPLAGRFPIHRVVEWHARDARAHGVEPPPMAVELTDIAVRIERACSAAPLPEVPCHNDLLPGNVLFAADRSWLLDFEYAGMNDRFFDLGNLSVNCALDEHGDRRLLAAYFGAVTDGHVARLQLMKVMSELREGMWAVVQRAISTLDTDFAGYAEERLASCHSLATTADMAEWLVAATAPLPT